MWKNAFLLVVCKDLPKPHNKILLPTFMCNFVSFFFLLSTFVYENLASIKICKYLEETELSWRLFTQKFYNSFF